MAMLKMLKKITKATETHRPMASGNNKRETNRKNTYPCQTKDTTTSHHIDYCLSRAPSNLTSKDQKNIRYQTKKI
jgi:hypothetical protein